MKPNNQDFYFQKAKKENFLARSIYKLQEIDERYKIIKKKNNVLDLGCYPGSWLQYISKKVGIEGFVVGVDITPLENRIASNVSFLNTSVLDLNYEDLKKNCPFYNVVVSDMAPNTTGIKDVDALKSVLLCEKALEIAAMMLPGGGNFVVKIFQGEGFHEYLQKVKVVFKHVRCFKPKGSKKQSREIYILGKDKR